LPLSKIEYAADAEALYVERGDTLVAIARALPVSLSTVRRWARDGDWARRRRVYRASPKSAAALAADLLSKKITELNELPPESVDAAVIKDLTALVKAVNELNKAYRPYELAVLAGGEFVNYVSRRVADPKLRQAIFGVYSNFVEEMRKAN
jgi:transposase-like protein